MLNHKKSMKLKLGVKFEVAKIEIDEDDLVIIGGCEINIFKRLILFLILKKED